MIWRIGTMQAHPQANAAGWTTGSRKAQRRDIEGGMHRLGLDQVDHGAHKQSLSGQLQLYRQEDEPPTLESPVVERI
jgi:hypothetical protein